MARRISCLIPYLSFLRVCSILVVLLSLSACERQIETPAPPPTTRIVISAVGDVMMPGSIQAVAARNKYNYDILFEKVSEDLAGSDITIANLETPVDHTAPVSGYPKFNSRPGLLSALKKAGIDVVSIANNHIMDQGVAGLKRTMDNISAAGLVFVGAGRTKAEADEVKYLSAKGITCAFLAFTYSTNERLPGRKAKSPGVNILRPDSKTDLTRAVENVQKARPGADIVIVSLHWGDEYSLQPTPWQQQVAEELVRAGADIILGHHPHVLQPIETVTTADGRHGIVAYSLGNFISSQNYGVSYKNKDHTRALRGDGIILNITTAKTGQSVSIERIEFVPIWTLREKVGRDYVRRPVSLAREVMRLEAIPSRSKEEENMLVLLRHRQKVIIENISHSPATNIP